jgi:hypothetical protein
MVRLLVGIERKCGGVASKVGVEDASEWGLLFITSVQQKVWLACKEITGLARLSVRDIKEE